MAYSEVKKFFEDNGFGDRLMVLNESSATAELAAKAIGCEIGQIAKTMTFLVEEKPIMIVCAGNVKIDNPKFKAFFHEKAKMIPGALVGEYVGHEIGGVCPFAVKDGVKIFLDESLKTGETVYPAAGDGHSVAELSLDELEKLAHAEEWIDVCKPMN